MSEQSPDFPGIRPVEPEAAAALEAFEWQFNHLAGPENRYGKLGWQVIQTLQDRYGPENILVSDVTKDADTGLLVYRRGALGVFVRKGAEARHE